MRLSITYLPKERAGWDGCRRAKREKLGQQIIEYQKNLKKMFLKGKFVSLLGS